MGEGRPEGGVGPRLRGGDERGARGRRVGSGFRRNEG